VYLYIHTKHIYLQSRNIHILFALISIILVSRYLKTLQYQKYQFDYHIIWNSKAKVKERMVYLTVDFSLWLERP